MLIKVLVGVALAAAKWLESLRLGDRVWPHVAEAHDKVSNFATSVSAAVSGIDRRR